MKKILVVALVASVTLISCKGEKKEKVEAKEAVKVEKVTLVKNVDVVTSVVTWKGAKPTGEHHGTVALKESSLAVENGTIKSGEFIIDMATITDLDMEAGKGKEKIEGHLKSPDFFDVEKYPTSKFVITGVNKEGNNLAVTGNLTIKDVTKSITIPATVSENDGVVTFKSEKFNIDRADFNVKYGSKKFFDNLKDKFVADLVEMSFEVKTKS